MDYAYIIVIHELVAYTSIYPCVDMRQALRFNSSLLKHFSEKCFHARKKGGTQLWEAEK